MCSLHNSVVGLNIEAAEALIGLNSYGGNSGDDVEEGDRDSGEKELSYSQSDFVSWSS